MSHPGSSEVHLVDPEDLEQDNASKPLTDRRPIGTCMIDHSDKRKY